MHIQESRVYLAFSCGGSEGPRNLTAEHRTPIGLIFCSCLYLITYQSAACDKFLGSRRYGLCTVLCSRLELFTDRCPILPVGLTVDTFAKHLKTYSFTRPV